MQPAPGSQHRIAGEGDAAWALFRCPECLGLLAKRPGALCCEECRAQFPLEDGIPVFTADEQIFYGEFSRTEMRHFLEAANTNLDEALARLLRQQNAPARLGEYVMGAGRAGWKFLLPISDRSIVVDIGCGWGAIGHNLAFQGGRVIAIDSTMERMRFLKCRAERDGLANIRFACAGDSEHLPLRDNTADLAILNGVLEWVPSGTSGDPRQAQLKFLREIKRVLKPGGVLFLAIENRFAWKTWFWKTDGHTGLRFVPWLPRSLAGLYSRFKGKGPYRNYLYGRRAYANLLRSAGFASAEFYVPLPGYHHPAAMVLADRRKAVREKTRRRAAGPSGHLKQFLKGWLNAWFPDAYGIVAAAEDQAPFISLLLKKLAAKELQEMVLEPEDYRINGEMGMVTILLANGDRNGAGAVIKLPLHRRAAEELSMECAAFGAIHAGEHPMGELHRWIPQSLGTGKFAGQPYFCYERARGVNGECLINNRPQLHNALASMERFAVKMGELTREAEPATMKQIEAHVGSLVGEVRTIAASSEQEQNLMRLGDAVIEALRDEEIHFVLAHGDFKLGNALFEPTTGMLTAVIDWGAGFVPVLPLYDQHFLWVDYLCRDRGQKLEAVLEGLLAGDEVANWVGARLEGQAHAMGINVNQQYSGALGRYQWLKRMSPLASGYEARRFDYRMIDAKFEVLRAV